MKKLLLLLVISISLSITAQESKTSAYAYCEIVGTGNMTGTKVKVEIDFGQKKSFWTQYKDNRLVDEKGEVIKFNSMVDAMNFMGSIGWEFIQAYVITEQGGLTKQNVYHFLLKKELKDGENLKDGFNISGEKK